MKKKTLALLVLGMIMINTIFANDISIDVNKKVLTAFENEFVKASDVSWIKNNDYYKASFQSNGQHLNAFFSEEGEMLGVSRNLITTELPINLQASLADEYSAFWVSGLFEYASNGESKYYITMEDADRELLLMSVGTSDWSVFTKKNKTL